MSETAAGNKPVSNSESIPENPNEESSRLVRIWRNSVRPIVLILLVIASFRSAVADWNDVPTQSMEPNILVGDRIFVNRLAYGLKVPFTTWHLAEWSAPARGDVVVFYAPGSGKRMVKRVMGLPGDTIELRRNKLFINNNPVEYAPFDAANQIADGLTDPGPHLYARERTGGEDHPIMLQPARGSRLRTMPAIQIPEGHFFMMGDNRDNSGDSRVFGFVPREQILGRAVGLAFSLDHHDHYLPRWDRFFRGID